MSVRDDTEVLLAPEEESVPEHDLHEQIVDLLAAGLRSRFGGRGDVAVHARLAWFPERFDTRVRLDPDVMVVFGRPQLSRSSYRQWQEENLPPTLLVEVWSERDTDADYRVRLDRARRYDVAEVLLVEPFRPGGVTVTHLMPRAGDPSGWATVAVSADADHPVVVPRLGVSFAGGPVLIAADERGVWPSTAEALSQLRGAQAQLRGAEAQLRGAQAQVATVEDRAARLAARLRAVGLDPDDESG